MSTRVEPETATTRSTTHQANAVGNGVRERPSRNRCRTRGISEHLPSGRHDDADRVVRRHPWVFEIGEPAGIDPNGARHFEQSLQAVSSLNLDLDTQLDLIELVDEYVFGFCLQEGDIRKFRDSSEGDRDEMIAYISQTARSGHSPRIEKYGAPVLWERMQAHAGEEDRFERNLQRLLDGIEHGFPRLDGRRSGATRRGSSGLRTT